MTRPLLRGLRLGLVLALAAVTMGLTSCGSSTEVPTSTGSAPEESTSVSSSSASSPSPAKGAAGTSDAKLAGQLCDLIRKVQTDLGTDALDAAYLAQYTIGLTNFLVDEDTVSKFRTKGDALAKAECPSEHSMFLTQAKIRSLAQL